MKSFTFILYQKKGKQDGGKSAHWVNDDYKNLLKKGKTMSQEPQSYLTQVKLTSKKLIKKNRINYFN